MLRKLRGILGTALVWGAGWLIGGGVYGTIIFLTGRSGFIGAAVIWVVALWFGFVGAVAGTFFSLILSLAQSGRTLHDLKLGRVALFGVLGSLIGPTSLLALSSIIAPDGGLRTIGEFLETSGILAILGAGSATGTLLAARRTSRELPPVNAGSGSLTSG